MTSKIFAAMRLAIGNIAPWEAYQQGVPVFLVLNLERSNLHYHIPNCPWDTQEWVIDHYHLSPVRGKFLNLLRLYRPDNVHAKTYEIYAPGYPAYQEAQEIKDIMDMSYEELLEWEGDTYERMGGF